MSEKSKHIIRCLFLFVIFLIMLFTGSKIVSYYQTGADPMSIYNSGYESNLNHANITTWRENDLSTEFPDIKYAVSKTINEVWYWLDQSYNQNKSVKLSDYFEEDLLSSIDSMIQNKVGTRSSISHELELQHVSLDKSVVVLKDHKTEVIYNFTLDETSYIPPVVDTIGYTAMMVLINGKWKIKNWISEKVELTKKKPTNRQAKEYLLSEISKIKGINYYPQEFPWQLFWTHITEEIIRNDFKIISGLGMNTVRIFLPYKDFEHSQGLTENTEKLSLLLDIAEAYDLYVLPTLFDFPVGYDIKKYGGYNFQLEHILSSVKEKPALLAWNIKNEPDLDFKIHGRGVTLAWLQYMVMKAKSYDPIHPITASWSKLEHLELLSDQLDFLSFHLYVEDKSWASKINNLSTTLHKPIVLEEFGMSTRSGMKNILGYSEEKQNQYTKSIIATAQDHNIPWMLWTLYDFENLPKGVFGWKPWIKSKQKNFGIIKADETPKKIYYSIKTILEQ